jgi:acyl dehydratase
MHERYFEDWNVDDRVETGSIELTRDAALDFARGYDPQPFHLDDAAAERSFFGKLAASGWQTASLAMRLIVESGAFPRGGVIGLGIEQLRWLKPVYPGDTLRVSLRIASLRAMQNRESGIVRFENTTYNQHDDAVMTHVAIAMIPRRTTSTA